MYMPLYLYMQYDPGLDYYCKLMMSLQCHALKRFNLIATVCIMMFECSTVGSLFC